MTPALSAATNNANSVGCPDPCSLPQFAEALVGLAWGFIVEDNDGKDALLQRQPVVSNAVSAMLSGQFSSNDRSEEVGDG